MDRFRNGNFARKQGLNGVSRRPVGPRIVTAFCKSAQLLAARLTLVPEPETAPAPLLDLIGSASYFTAPTAASSGGYPGE